jgi:hypothetical protein
MVSYTRSSFQHGVLTSFFSPTPPPLSPCTDFMTEYPEYVVQNNAMNFLSDNGGKDYNLCHCTCLRPKFNQRNGTH